MIINIKKTIEFAKLSKDRNQIHLSKKFSKNFFFKEPIVHGVNAAIKGISFFLKKKNKPLFITNVNIEFKNFLFVNEDFEIILKKKSILIVSKKNVISVINIEYKESKFYLKKTNSTIEKNIKKKFNLYNLNNINIIQELLFISYFVGVKKPGNGSLIHKIEISTVRNIKRPSSKKISIRKIVKRIFQINYLNKFYKVNVVASKIPPFKFPDTPKLSPGIQKVIKNKKILIFGSTGDIAQYIKRIIGVNNCYFYSYSFRIFNSNMEINDSQKKRIKKFLLRVKPDFIFYLSSPPIIQGTIKNKALIELYNLVYIIFFKLILKITTENKIITKFFYPSTYFIKEKKNFKRLGAYITVKEKAEKIFSLRKYRKLISIFSLPKILSRGNYNFLGFYEGETGEVIKKKLESFFKL